MSVPNDLNNPSQTNSKTIDIGILVSQLNLQRSITPVEYINNWLINSPCNYLDVKGKVALLQEPYLSTRNLQPTGFNKDLKVFIGANTGRIRAVIATDTSVNAFKLTQFCNQDMVTICVSSNNKSVILSSVYMPGDSHDPPPCQLIRDLAIHCHTKGLKLTIGGDINGHNVLWGSTKNNLRGEAIADWLLSSDLHICNKGNTPTFSNSIRGQVLDATFCSTNMLDYIENWHVSEDETYSDHHRIEFSIVFEYGINDNTTNNFYRNVKKTNFVKYVSELKNNLNSCIGTTLDEMADELENAIKQAFEASCKEQKATKTKKPPWWTKELTTLQKLVKKRRQRARRVRSEININEYKESRRKYNYTIRDAKSKGWEKLCTEMESLTTTARIQKILKMGRKQEIGTVKKPDGSFTDTPEETLQVLLDTHFPDKEEEEQLPQDNLPTENNLDIEGIVNEQSVRAAFRSFKPYKAPGTDGIFPILIQKGMDVIVHRLVDIFKKSLKEGRAPKRWLESKIVFIPKPGKMDYSDPKSMRPISLTSFFFKGLERTIHWHILRTSLRQNKFHKNLYSYREGISTEDILHKLQHKVEKALEKKEMVMVLFCDISAAFSAANVTGMVKNMLKKGIEPGLINWITNSLTHRQAIATLNGQVVMKMVNRGTPQGGILSVDYWNANMDDLLNRFPEGLSGDVNAFADDIMDMIGGIDEDSMVSILQDDIKIMEKWARENSLSFSASKTKVMLFTNKRKFKKPKLFMDHKEIEWVDNFKYLGVTLDTKLLYTNHVETISKRAMMTLAQCRRQIGRNWGLKPHICKWVYTSLIRPIISYSSLTWINSTTKSTHMKKLARVQRQGCLATLNAMKTTPTAGMEVILDIRPIDIHLKEIAINSYLRLCRNSNWIPIPGEVVGDNAHSNIVLNIMKEMQEVRIPTDNLLNKEYIVSKFDTIIKPRQEMESAVIKLTPTEPGFIHCFTDGSKTKYGSGCAYILRGNGEKAQDYLTLGKISTVFQAEVFAIGEACREMIARGINGLTINFYIDSQAAIFAINKYIINSQCVLSTKNDLNLLSSTNKTSLIWLPSHCNHLGNEVADRLAKRGAYNTGDGPEPFLPVSRSYIKNIIRKWGERKHQKRWQSTTEDYKETRLMLPKIKNNSWKFIKGRNRRGAMYCTQILTGHGSVNKHLFKMKLADSPNCRKCDNNRESIEHILGSCPAHNLLRRDVLGDYTIPSGDLCRLKLKDIMTFFNRTARLIYVN